jgi:hypothetical protein
MIVIHFESADILTWSTRRGSLCRVNGGSDGFARTLGKPKVWLMWAGNISAYHSENVFATQLTCEALLRLVH